MLVEFERYMALSAVNVDSCRAFIRTLALLFRSYDIKFTSTQRRYLSATASESQDFVRQFKLTKKFDTAVKSIVAGGNPAKEDLPDEKITDLIEALVPLKPKLDKETDISRWELQLINDFRLVQLRNSEAALKRIHKNVSQLGDPQINAMFVTKQDVKVTGKTYQAFDKLVAKYGGASEGAIPTEQLKKWTALHKKTGERHKDHALYLKLRREINATMKDGITNAVRNCGEVSKPIADVIAELDRQKIRHTIPKTFVGNMDCAGNFYTVAGKKLGAKLTGEVIMNPNYDPKKDNAYVCQYKAPFAVDYLRVYTEDYRAGAKQDKFEVAAQTRGNLDKLTRKWVPDFKSKKLSTRILAVVCELIYETSARVGSRNASTAGQQTFGASQLQARHFKKLQNGYTIQYKGKSGQNQKHVIKFTTVRLKQMGKVLEELLEGKTGKDYVFAVKPGKPVTGAAINKYIRSNGFPAGFTVHMLRTIKGSELAEKLLKKIPFKRGGDWSERDVHKWIETELLKVGAALGHASNGKVTAATAIQNYIDPQILKDLYAKLGIRPNARIQKAIDAAGK